MMLRTFIYKLPQNVRDCFRGYNLLWHAAAVAATFVLVMSGFDWAFFEATRYDALAWFIISAGVGGFFVPVLVPLALYVAGDVRKNTRLMMAGAAVGQASFIAYCVSSAYKAFTGRLQPEFLTHYSTTDISRAFQFGWLENGIFWGWPSSHAAVAVAGAVALLLIYKESKLVVYAAPLYALYISIGAAIGFHWLSDAVAGVLLGTMIGLTVGRSFRKKAERC